MFRKINFNKKTTSPKKKKRKPVVQQEQLRDQYGGRDRVCSIYDVKLRDIPHGNEVYPHMPITSSEITTDDSPYYTSGDDGRFPTKYPVPQNKAETKPVKVQVSGPVQWHHDMSPIRMLPVPADQLTKGNIRRVSSKMHERPSLHMEENWSKDDKEKTRKEGRHDVKEKSGKEGRRLLPQRVPSRRVTPLPTVPDVEKSNASTISEPVTDYSDTGMPGLDIKSSHGEFSSIIQEKNFDDIELSMICIDCDETGVETDVSDAVKIKRWPSTVSKYIQKSPGREKPNDAGKSGENGFPMELFQTYFEAIARDDTEQVTATIDKIPKGGMDCILNGSFEFEYPPAPFSLATKDVTQSFLIRQMNVCRPLCLAALYKSKQVFNLLIDKGANPFMPDANHNNIIHILILGCFFQPESERDYIEIYRLLISRVQHDVQWAYLLHTENLDTLRPMEMAIKLKRFTFFKEILYTSDVDRTIAGCSGTIRCCIFDMSSYAAIRKRQTRSPVQLLFETNEDEFETLANSNILQEPVIRAWVEAIWLRNLPYLIAWVILFRLLYLLVFLSFDIKCYGLFVQYRSQLRSGMSGVPNDTALLDEQLKVDKNSMRVGFMFLFVISLISILFDLVSVVYYMISRWKQHAKKLPAWLQSAGQGYVHKMFFFYRLHYFSLAIITVIHSSIEFNGLTGSDPSLQTFCSVLLIGKYLLALVAISYFLLVVPVIDIFVIGLQRVIFMVYIFILMYVPVYVIFLAMIHYILTYHCSVQSRLHSDFSTETYLIRVSTEQLTHCSREGIFLALLVQYLHLFVFCILFLNHLVTYIFTDFCRFAKYRCVIVTLVKVHMACIIENRIGRHRYSVMKKEPINICEFCNERRSVKHVCAVGMYL